MRKPLNTTVPEDLISRVDDFVVKSKGDFRDRSHLVEQAIKAYLEEDLPVHGPLAKTAAASTPIENTESSLYETSLFPRLSMNIKEKKAIAEQAAALIENGKTLFIDGSTTCRELAKVLARQKKRLTVVTNSALICLELGHSGSIRVINIGGEYDPHSASSVGPMCEEAIEKFYFDYMLVSTKGFLPEEGTFESSMGTLRIKEIGAQHCARLILLVDYSKFGQRALCKVLDITRIQTIVTDAKAPQGAIDFLRQNGHEVVVAHPNDPQKEEDEYAA